ncbi:MAG: hypothetical protein P1U63_10410 [Coxiellaceae bacterium]|nr:hypothetical protein [Coxiellaceae bacterium]
MRVHTTDAAGHKIDSATHLQALALPGEAPLRRNQQKKIDGLSVNVSEVQKTARGIHLNLSNQVAFLISCDASNALQVKPYQTTGSHDIDLDGSQTFARLVCMSRSTHLLIQTHMNVTELQYAMKLQLMTEQRKGLDGAGVLPALNKWFARKTQQQITLAEVDCQAVDGKVLIIDSLDKATTSTAIDVLSDTVAPEFKPDLVVMRRQPATGFSAPTPGPASSRQLLSQPVGSLFAPTSDIPHACVQSAVAASSAGPTGALPMLSLALVAGGSPKDRSPATPRGDASLKSPAVPVVEPSPAPKPKAVTPSPLPLRRPPPRQNAFLRLKAPKLPPKIEPKPSAASRGRWLVAGLVAFVGGVVLLRDRGRAKETVKAVASSMRPK